MNVIPLIPPHNHVNQFFFLVVFLGCMMFFLLEIVVRTTFDQFYGIPFAFCNGCFKQLDYEVTEIIR